MTKRGTKKSTKSTKPSSKGYEKTIRLLIENNVMLQGKLVNLTSSIDGMNKQMGKILHLIEIASTDFSKKESEGEGHENLIEKLESLINQNKTIAKGLILLEKFVREKTGSGPRRRDDFEPLPEFKF